LRARRGAGCRGRTIRKDARVDAGVVRRSRELEPGKHDVIAFTMAVGEAIGDPSARELLPLRLTSNDVVDTAQALHLRRLAIDRQASCVSARCSNAARGSFSSTPQIGRTHGVHAEPITFGLKIGNGLENRATSIASARRAADGCRKISATVATHRISTGSGSRLCERLGLDVAPVRRQVIQRRPARGVSFHLRS